MTGSDIGTLRQIRSRRLDQATADKQRCDRKLADAEAAEAEAERAVEQARLEGQRRIDAMYASLLAAGICTVKDLDDVRFAEALLREQLAQLAKERKDAAAATEAAGKEVEEAGRHLAAMHAAVEAIDLLAEEQRAEQRIEDARREDEIIDEVALLRR